MVVFGLVLFAPHFNPSGYAAELKVFSHKATNSYFTVSQTCGTSSEYSEFFWDGGDDGSGYESIHVDESDCWDERYGDTDYEDDHYWNYPTSGAVRNGWLNGVYYQDEPITLKSVPTRNYGHRIATCTYTENQPEKTRYRTNSTYTTMTLKTGPGWSEDLTGYQWVAVEVSATGWEYDCADGAWGSWASKGSVPFQFIHVLGREVNAENHVWYQANHDDGRNATPAVSDSTYKNYTFDVSIASHRVVELSWTFHPKFVTGTKPSLLGIQLQGQRASEILGWDHDTMIPDGDPSADKLDDVPFYAEFHISEFIGLAEWYHPPDGSDPIDVSSEAVFVPEYHEDKYYDVWNGNDASNLLYSGMSNIMRVESLIIDGQEILGWALLSSPPSILITSAGMGDPETLAHEWCHTRGLEHRGDPGALMKDPDSGREINRTERSQL